MSATPLEPSLRQGAGDLVPAVYLGVAVIVADQVTQLLAGQSSFDPGSAAWRFQVASIIPSRVGAMSIGLLLLWAVGQWFGRPRAVRVAGWGLVALGVLLLAGFASLWFDGAAVKGLVGAGGLEGFVRTWLRLVVLSGSGSLLFAALALWSRSPTSRHP